MKSWQAWFQGTLRLENWKNVGFGENGVIGGLDNLRESSWDATAKTGGSERWLGQNHSTENSSFPRCEKKWGKKKENETSASSGEKKKGMRTGQPYQILEHTWKPRWIQWGVNMKTGRQIEAAGPRVSGFKRTCMWNPVYDKGAISNETW